MKNTIITVVLTAMVGLVLGYVFFGKIGGEYISLSTLLKPAENSLIAFGQKISGIESIKNNIAICGGVGALAGIAYRVIKK
ncbi:MULTISPECIES: hypothetical protein [unclassified Carboxylicivirga]|uniref:hypothetical protein n=1 Tax=Carboxylicivirga TaxID=1628153 RepID=UPI003D34551D